MKKSQLILSIMALVAGAMIVLASFLSSRSMLTNSRNPQSQRQLYFGQVFLPDHLFYPVLALVDRVRLETAPPQKRLELQLAFGRQRLADTEGLIEKNRLGLAYDTLVKSQKYFLFAAAESLAIENNTTHQQQVLQELVLFAQKTDQLKNNFSDAQQADITTLLSECEATKLRLEQSLL